MRHMQLFARRVILTGVPVGRARKATPMSSRSWSTSAALGLVLACASLCAVADVPRYRVELDESRQAKVQLCFAQAHDTVSFAADSPWAMRFIADLARSSGGDVDS